MILFTRWLFFVSLALAGFVARYVDKFIPSLSAPALEMLRQAKVHRTITQTNIAMFAWVNKVADKSYILLFGGKKDFTVLRNTAFG
jgi:hypothetical protein